MEIEAKMHFRMRSTPEFQMQMAFLLVAEPETWAGARDIILKTHSVALAGGG
jgi:hypothetical protein